MGLLLAFFTPAPAQAAAPDYAFSVSLGTYDDISDETGYTVSTATGDDGAEDIALPFTFTYDGVGYTTGRISVNGWIAGGTGYTGAGYENDLASTVARPLLAPLWDDLNDDASSEIGYTILGTEPNRVVVVQWSDVLWEVSEGTPQNFQVRLYETTNVIQFIYGAMSAPSGNPSASIGINDATGGSGHFLSITPAAGTADTVSSTTANNAINSAQYLPGGKTYTFTPVDPNAPLPCAINVSPADGATDVFRSATLNWRSGGGQVDGYRLYFGADNPPTNLVNGTDLGNVTTYDPPDDLAPNTTYYWQVVPYNGNGAATGCPVWSFTTGASTIFFSENFTGATFPPTGWTIPAAGACAWSRVTAGSNPTQTPYSLPAEAKFNSYDCDAGGYKQLLSPALDFSVAGEYRVTFWMYHDTGHSTNADRIQVQVSLDGGGAFTDVGAEIYRYTGATGWTQHTLDLSTYAGQAAVNVVFKGISGYGNNMFIDDVQVIQTAAVAPPNCAVTPDPANGATGVPLARNLTWANGGGGPEGYRVYLGTDNPPTNLANGADVGNATTYDPAAPLAANTLHFWQVVPYNSFGNAANCPVWSFTSGPAPISAFPYVQGFESGAGGWTSGGANSSWALGTPADATIVGASSGSNAWTTGLTTHYNNDEQSYVQSPAFDFSSLTHPHVKFDLWWDAQEGSDGANLQVSVDGGATWEAIGLCCIGERNWYNFFPDVLGPEMGWSGDAATDAAHGTLYAGYGWRTATLELNADVLDTELAGEPYVLFRFFFGSDDSGWRDGGFAFDNFELREGCIWTGAVNTSWHVAGNWDCGHVPGAEEIASLPWISDTAPDPTISAAAAVSAVSVGDDLILNGGDLTTRYVYEEGIVYIAEGNAVNLIGSGNAWEATWETQAYWDDQWGAATNGLVRFSGPGVQRIVHDYNVDYFPRTAYAQFYDVRVENGSYVEVRSNLLAAHNLIVQSGGTLDMTTFSLGVNGGLTNSGALRQQKTLGAAYYDAAFFDTGGYGGLKLNPSGFNLGPTTVQIRGGQDCTSVPGETAKRCFDIAPTTSPGSPGVAVTFYFTAADLPVGHTCETVELYHHDGITWSQPITRDLTYGTAGRICSGALYSIRVTGVTDFSPFVLTGSGAAPTAVTLTAFAARVTRPWVYGVVVGLLLAGGGCFWQARRVFTSKNNRERAASNAR
jgi:hypothetical protein